MYNVRPSPSLLHNFCHIKITLEIHNIDQSKVAILVTTRRALRNYWKIRLLSISEIFKYVKL